MSVKLFQCITYDFKGLLHSIAYNGNRIIEYGLIGVAKRIARKILIIILGFISLPISIIIHFAGYRRLGTFTSRIGHLAIEPDLILKAQKLGLIRPRKWIIAAPAERVANSHLLRYWKPHFRVVESGTLCFLLECLTFWGFSKQRTDFLINQTNKSQLAYKIYSSWGSREPLLSVTDEDREWFKSQKAKLGLPPEGWYVCVHAREAGFSPVDEPIQGYRNCSVKNLTLAINEIVSQGGWVVRLGDPTTVKLQPLENVIDYAHCESRSERMDLLLCANAKFILGNTSGIVFLGSIFGVPCALANMVPMSVLGIGIKDVSIPKIYVHSSSGHMIPFGEIMKSPASNFRQSILYEKSGIELRENSPEEILYFK